MYTLNSARTNTETHALKQQPRGRSRHGDVIIQNLLKMTTAVVSAATAATMKNKTTRMTVVSRGDAAVAAADAENCPGGVLEKLWHRQRNERQMTRYQASTQI